ncbi:hypothetical protein BFP71_01625 [Roseivirga misakiensis]|uniref:Uncharacterized protein n=2 Tax=Roseivirga misakiensis TaxID=1563681 RepID=A0A1E5T4U8_9BACT|nr:hypothetical protein BFP71_01625 [Roseivirga misakiensis]
MISVVGCSSTKGLEGYSVDANGAIQAYKSNMNKDVIRLKGELMTKGKRVGDRWEYLFKVNEVLKYGDTFSTVAPNVSEEVVLFTPTEVKFKKNSEVVLDAFTPIKRGVDKLIINMVID